MGVGAVVLAAGRDEVAEAAEEAAEETAEDTAELADEATEEITEETAEDTLLAAEEVAEALDRGGAVTVTPAALHVPSTPLITAAWSEAEHAFCTQGVTEATRVSNFWQWHLKSVSSAHPSEPRGPKKQANYQ